MNKTQIEISKNIGLQNRQIISSNYFFSDDITYEFKFATESFSTIYCNKIQSQYDKLLQRISISEPQNNVVKNIIDLLLKSDLINTSDNIFKIENDNDEQVLITRFFDKKMSFVAVDDEGDIMLSIIDKDSEKKEPDFFDYNDYDAKRIVGDMLD